jgi:SAM-dependent methyltransferase
MTDTETASRQAAEFWNSPSSRAWADYHEPIDALFSGITEAVLRIAAPQPGEHVLDIGCGAGTTTLELAARIGPAGHVLGADISENSVAKLRERIAAGGVRNAEVLLADVGNYAFAPARFDLAFSRPGVMFFGDPPAALSNVRRAMKPSGRLAFAVFRTPAENPFTVGPTVAVRQVFPALTPPGPNDPGMFSWADATRTRQLFHHAGYQDVRLTPLDLDMRFAPPGAPAEAAELAMMIGQVSRALAAAPDQRDATRVALTDFFRHHDGPNGISLSGALWIVEAGV